ncbi:hypothetical protein IW262DRAFT_1032054 [Armillaria fumosa]|nr:hypothetical protein IW262DRAFT_1032054 [Armillaria fumosa]
MWVKKYYKMFTRARAPHMLMPISTYSTLVSSPYHNISPFLASSSMCASPRPASFRHLHMIHCANTPPSRFSRAISVIGRGRRVTKRRCLGRRKVSELCAMPSHLSGPFSIPTLRIRHCHGRLLVYQTGWIRLGPRSPCHSPTKSEYERVGLLLPPSKSILATLAPIPHLSLVACRDVKYFSFIKPFKFNIIFSNSCTPIRISSDLYTALLPHPSLLG